MRRNPGRDGRPLEALEEAELFRSAFPEDWEGMRRAARGEEPADAARRARWEAAVEIVRRALSAPSSLPGPFRSAADVFDRYRYLVADYRVEVFLAVLLDVKNRPMQDHRVSTGILNGSLIHPREVFAPAVRERASSILLVHNHPSGDPAPSPEDREATRRLRSAGGIVGIAVLDHVIIGDGSFYSFREEADW
ncbi:MAG TPA: JAB domain-containing protein [Candidatus Limnocylindrales bacterium]|nr:JAB domain-containing protein [Candidatus Limnocylindrales bacterium]